VKAIRRLGPCLALIVALGACGDDAQPDGSELNAGSLTSALQEVRQLVDDTAEALLPGQAKEPAPDNEEVINCVEAAGGSSDDVMSQFGYRIDLPDGESASSVLEAARRFWEENGHEVIDDNIDDDFAPAIFISSGGYDFQFAVNEVDQVILGGSTPCFPPGSNRD